MCIPVIIFACSLLLVAAVSCLLLPRGAGAAAGGGTGDGAERRPVPAEGSRAAGRAQEQCLRQRQPRHPVRAGRHRWPREHVTLGGESAPRHHEKP